MSPSSEISAKPLEVGRPWRASSLPRIGARRKFRTFVSTVARTIVALATIAVPDGKGGGVMAVRSALAGLVVVKVQHVAGGIPWEFTMHGRTNDNSANTTTKMDAVAAAVADYVDGLTAALMNNANSLTGVAVQDLSPALLPDSVHADSVTGTRGSSLVPQSSCCVVTKRTAQVGRAFRGRCYISGAIASDLDGTGTEWDSAYASSCKDYVQACVDAMLATSPTAYKPVIYHRKAGQGGSPAADTVSEVTSLLGRTELAQQKSRRS